MPSNELKQRRKTTQGKPHEQTTEIKPKAEPGKGADEPDRNSQTSAASPPSAVDIRTITCLLSLAVCLVLTWVVLLQAARFADIEEKSRLLYEKAADIEGLSNEISEISRKLDASEEDLQGALSSMSLVAKMDNDVSGLRSVIAAVQGGEQFVSQNMQSINRSFQNATDVWRRSLEGITQDIGNLKSDSKALHNQVTAKINKAEKTMRSISEKLEELEDSTKRNARALERTESEDVEGVEEQVRWNRREIERLEEQHQALGSRGRELSAKIAEYQPRARQCEEQLPVVEDAVRSILRVSSELAGLEKRVEDLTVQVFNMEDNMLKVVSEILEIKTALDALEVDNSILKLRNELGVIKEKVREFERARREPHSEEQSREGAVEN
ncbi:inhibitor of nuclear factor kappa-B kinase-interacting protein isoform X1 [Lepisosteus oculatus]|uniref:inhibitor of nuclear factor kappa-B kinase-interacting protein isoform X1 n=1 Tax=Lepisosteus oculatus TaxID=7918 RepID=UPI00371B6E12